MNKRECKFTRKVILSYTFNDCEKTTLVSSKLKELGFEISTVSDSVNDNIEIDKYDCIVLVVTEKNCKMFLDERCNKLIEDKPTFTFINRKLCGEDKKEPFSNSEIILWDDENELAHCIIEEFSRYGYRHPLREFQFECIVREFFENYGFLTKISNSGKGYNISAEKEDVKFYIEAKAVRQRVISRASIARTLASAIGLDDIYDSRFILVAANELSAEAWNYLNDKNDILVIDIRNLLYMVQYDEVLNCQLLSILEYSIEDIEPRKPTKLMELIEAELQSKCETVNTDEKSNDNENTEQLIEAVKSWEPKVKNSIEYEELCIKVLKNLFVTDLTLWNKQQMSNEGLYRFDLICKIKDDIQEAFWIFIEKYFRTKYIIFEFKNYSKEITQKEIYTTEKYLYAKAFRCVAIIISCHGEDKNAKKAISGTFRENGKLIISISNKDLIDLLNKKLQGCSPAEYLYNKLDEMLIKFGK